jgi:hypothetical protein
MIRLAGSAFTDTSLASGVADSWRIAVMVCLTRLASADLELSMTIRLLPTVNRLMWLAFGLTRTVAKLLNGDDMAYPGDDFS